MSNQTKTIKVVPYFDKGYGIHNISPANPCWILYDEWEKDPRKDGSIYLNNGLSISGGQVCEGCVGNNLWKENAGLWLVRAKFKEGWQYPKYCCPSDKWQLYGYSPRHLAVKKKLNDFNDFLFYWEFDDFQPLRNY